MNSSANHGQSSTLDAALESWVQSLAKDGNVKVWASFVERSRRIALLSKEKSLYIQTDNGDVLPLSRDARVNEAFVYHENGRVFVCVVQHLNRVDLFDVDVNSIQVTGSVFHNYKGSVSHIVKIPHYGLFVCAVSAPEGPDRLSLLDWSAGSDLREVVHRPVAIDSGAKLVNLATASASSSPVVFAFHNNQRQGERRVEVAVMDVLHVISSASADAPIPVVGCNLRSSQRSQRSTLSLFRSADAADLVVTDGAVETVQRWNVHAPVHTLDHLHFVCRLSVQGVKDRTSSVYTLEMRPALLSITEAIDRNLGPKTFSAIPDGSGRFSSSAETSVNFLTSTESVVHLRLGQEELLSEKQVNATLGESGLLWDVCQQLHCVLPTRQPAVNAAVSAVAIADAQLPPDEALFRSRQRLLLEAALALRRTEVIVASILDRTMPSSSSSSSSTAAAGFSFGAPYTLRNIQDVFAWVLGDTEHSLHHALLSSLQDVVHQHLVQLLFVPRQHRNNLLQLRTTALVNELLELAQSVEQIVQALYKRKLESLREELLLTGRAQQPKLQTEKLIYAGDLASHSLAVLQLHVTNSRAIVRWVSTVSALLQDDVFATSAVLSVRDPRAPLSTVLERWQEVREAVNVGQAKVVAEELQEVPLLGSLLQDQVLETWPGLRVPRSEEDEATLLAGQSSKPRAFYGHWQSAARCLQSMTLASMANWASLWLQPLVLAELHREFLLESQAYDGLSHAAFGQVFDQHLTTSFRAWSYWVVAHTVIAYQAVTRDMEHGVVNNVYRLSVLQELGSRLGLSDHEVDAIVTLILVDLDDNRLNSLLNWSAATEYLSAEAGQEVFRVLVHDLIVPEARQLLHPLATASAQTLEHSFGFVLIRRLLVRGHPAAARQLLQLASQRWIAGQVPTRDIPSRDRVGASFFGLLAWIAAIPDAESEEAVSSAMATDDDAHSSTLRPEMWFTIWQEVRGKLRVMSSAAEVLHAKRRVTQCLAAWTLRAGCFAELVAHEDLDLVEIDALVVFLRPRAEEEVLTSAGASPAVDTLVAFLLKHHHREEAEQWHQRHMDAVLSSIQRGEQSEDAAAAAVQSIADRGALLAAESGFLQHRRLPAADYALSRHLPRVHHLPVAPQRTIVLPSPVPKSPFPLTTSYGAR